MRWHQVVVLWLVAAVLGAAWVFTGGGSAAKPEASRPPRARFLEASPDDVTAIRLERGGRIIGVRRDAGRWAVVEPPGVEIPEDLITAFTEALVNAEEIDQVAAPISDVRTFGFAEGADRVELTLANGPPIAVVFGSTNPTGTAVYARRGNGTAIVLIGRNVRYYQDLLYQSMPPATVPEGTPDARIGAATPLTISRAAV